ncbi:MAG: hypothetical protein ABIQ04_03605 [Candidatus Saccharimonadales bacterium]
MLLQGSRLNDVSVMGLQTGTELARTTRPIINPDTLEILAYEVRGPLLDMHPSLLRVIDVREFSDIGLIVDSSDEFIATTDVIKLEKVYELNFILVGMSVVDQHKRKLGKVTDFTLESGSFVIQQLNVKRPLLKSLGDTELLINRTQIIEITNRAIVVRSGEKKLEPIIEAVRTNYVNPFRSQSPTPEHIDKN